MRLIALVCLLVSCGTAGRQTAIDPGRRDNDGPIKDCQGLEVEQKPLAKGFRYIDGNRLFVKNVDQRRVSLCDAAVGTKVMVYQLAGITCITCQDEAQFLNKTIRTDDVGHSVVFTDFPEDYSELDFSNFMQDFAPGSKRYHDEKINLWKMFSQDPAHPVRPTILVFGKAGVSYLYNTEGVDITLTIKSVVEKLGAVIPPKPDPGPKPDPDDDLKIDQQLTDLNSRSFKLSDVFTREFAVIDFSQWNCIYCKRAADAHNADPVFQKVINDGKCDLVTFIPGSDLNSWSSRYKSSFVGDRSFSVDGKSLRQVASEYGFNLRGTPSYIIINRDGELLDSQSGALPRSFSATCKPN